MTRRTIYPTVAAVVVLVAIVAWPRSSTPAPTNRTNGQPSERAVPARSLQGPASTTATTAPSAPATTQSTASQTPPPPPPALPSEFAIFQSRNPFTQGKSKPGAAAANAQEASLVLKGTVDVEARMVAFVEDRGAKRVVQLAAGEPVARGKVKTITLDGIEYEAGGNIKRIAVGQNLNGEVVPPTPTSKPGPAQPPPGQPGQPMPGQPMPPGAMPMPPGQPAPGRPTKGAPQPVPEG
jgi:hypothetical protein